MGRFILAWGLVLSVGASAAAGQSYSELRGRVADEQGAVMPGVTIVVRNQDSGQFREAVSGTDGSYLVTALLPGVYEVSAELTGFKKFVRRDVRLAVGEAQSIVVRLEVGTLEETITVTGQSPLVDLTSKTVGGNVDNAELVETPVGNRSNDGEVSEECHETEAVPANFTLERVTTAVFKAVNGARRKSWHNRRRGFFARIRRSAVAHQVGTGSAQIRRSIAPNSRRVR